MLQYDVFRKIFGYKRCKPVSDLQLFWEDIPLEYFMIRHNNNYNRPIVHVKL